MASSQQLEAFSEKITQFLKTDKDGFSSEQFDSTRYLVQLLTDPSKKADLLELFNSYVEQENKCEEIIIEGIDIHNQKLNSLMDKPTIYGQQYEQVRSITSQSRRNILKSKELLSKKKIDMKLYFYNQIYVREVSSALDSVEQFQNCIISIENCVRGEQYYEACCNLKQAGQLIYSFNDLQLQSLVVKQMKDQEKQKQKEVFNLLAKKLSYFSFFFEDHIELLSLAQMEDSLDSQTASSSTPTARPSFTLERIKQCDYDINISFNTSKEFDQYVKEYFGVDLNKYLKLSNKLDQISNTITDEIIDLDNPNTLHYFSQFNYDTLITYIKDFCIKLDDITQVEQLWSDIGDDIDLLIPRCSNHDIIALFMLLHSSQLINKSNEILQQYYQKLNEDINTSFWLMQLFFIQKLINSKSPNYPFSQEGVELFQNTNFVNPYHLEILHDFLKQLLCFCAIVMKKQMVLIRVINKLDISLSEVHSIRSLSHIAQILISQLETTLHSFIFRPFDSNQEEYANENTKLHKFLQNQIRDIIRPTLITFPFILNPIRDCFSTIIDAVLNAQQSDNKMPSNKDEITDMELQLKSLVESLLNWDMDRYNQFIYRLCKQSISTIFSSQSIDNPSTNTSNALKYNLKMETASIYNQIKEKDKSSSNQYERLIQKMLQPHEDSLLSLYTSAKYVFPQIPQCLKNINQLLCIYKISPTKLFLNVAVNVINYQLEILINECNIKLKQAFNNTYIDQLLQSQQLGKMKALKLNQGYIKWSNKKFNKLRIIQHSLNHNISLDEYHTVLKSEYKEYFKKQNIVEEEFLFSKSNDISYVACLLVSLELYINQVNKFIEDFIDLEHFDRIKEQLNIQQVPSLESNSKSNNNNTLISKLKLIQQFIESQKQNESSSMHNEQQQDQSQKEQDQLSVSLPKLVKYMNQLLEIADKCYLSIKLNIHLQQFGYIIKQSKNISLIQRARQFSSTNISDYYQELFRFYSTISLILPEETLDFLFDDFVWMLKKSFRSSFDASKDYQLIQINTLIKDIKILVQELIKIPQLEKLQKSLIEEMQQLQQLFSLNMVQEDEILDFLKQNTYKYTIHDIQYYFDCKPLSLNNNQQQTQKRSQLLSDAAKYLIQKPQKKK